MDYRTTIELNSNDYQLVLASQIRGTFFCVYAKFEPKGNNEFEVHLEVKNYRGGFRVGIEKVEVEQKIVAGDKGGYVHLKIQTSFSNKNRCSTYYSEGEKKELILKLKKNDFFIVERNSSKQPDISDFYVSEDEHINIKNEGENTYKTQYSLEKELGEKLIEDIKNNIKTNKNRTAASEQFCVIGVSKMI